MTRRSNIISNSRVHRVLVFQGGGALGAYEAGIYKALCERLRDETENNKPLFNVVAGTSAGAINAALIVNHVLHSKGDGDPWKSAANVLEDYWTDSSTDTFLYENPYFESFINTAEMFRDGFNSFWSGPLRYLDNTLPDVRNSKYLQPFHYFWFDRLGKFGSKEAFRKYLSYLQFTNFFTGTHNVLSGPIYQPDFRFMNPFNFLIKYDNTALTKTIKKYWDYESYPIKTEDPQPRLLLVAVDVQDATTITFDSYPKRDGERISVYGDENDGEKHIVRYDNGIGIEHLLTTMSSHVRVDFPTLNAITSKAQSDSQIQDFLEKRPYMDGFYLSNTPLREVLQLHRDYWFKVRDMPYDVPALDIYIGDLYPQKKEGIPVDPDAINNRVQDVLFHDKTRYDEKVTTMVSDYVNIINELMNMVKSKDDNIDNDGIFDLLKENLSKKVVSYSRKGTQRDIEDLLKGRFAITQVQRIVYGESQNSNSYVDIFGKAFDYSSTTIKNLIIQGYKDTNDTLDLNKNLKF